MTPLPTAMYRTTDNINPDVLETMRDAQVEALRRMLREAQEVAGIPTDARRSKYGARP